MGQQQAIAKAVGVLRHALEQVQPPLSEEQKKAIVEGFEKELSPISQHHNDTRK